MDSWPRSREVEKVKPTPGNELPLTRGQLEPSYVPADPKQYAICQTRGHAWGPQLSSFNPLRCQWCGLRVKLIEQELNAPTKGKA